MKKIYTIIALISVFGCGKSEDIPFIEPTVVPYYNEFVGILKENNIPFENKVTIQLVETFDTENKLGLCSHSVISDTSQILLLKKFWNAAGEWDRRVLLFHEMGHCVLDRRHEDEMLTPTMPKSLMKSIRMSGKLLEENYNYYIYELLFNR